MARRIPLPRLTQRQRSARWQRERRQQAVIIVAFSSLLLACVALLAYTAADRYWTANLRPAANVGATALPWRDYQAEVKYQLVKFYNDNNVPPEYENDSQLAATKGQYDGI